METNCKDVQTHSVVNLGTLRVGEHFLWQGKRWTIYGQLGDISYCNCGDSHINEFNDVMQVEVPTETDQVLSNH